MDQGRRSAMKYSFRYWSFVLQFFSDNIEIIHDIEGNVTID